MKLTPLDLQHHTFKKVLRGFDPEHVSAFLDLVRSEWEDLLKEKEKIFQELKQTKKRLNEYQEKEKNLQETLITAQRITDEMKQTTQKEAEIVIGQAELQADKILQQAHDRLTQIIDEINDLKRQRAEIEGKVRGILESHLRLLDLQKETKESVNLENLGVLPKVI